MAFAFTSLASSTNTSAATSYATGSYTPTTNALVLAFVVASDTTAAGSFSGNGLNWVEVATARYDTNGVHKAWLFRAMGGAPSAGAGTFDCTGDAATGAAIHVVQITGTDTTGTNGSVAIVQSDTATAGVKAFVFAVATTSGNAVFQGWGDDVNPAGITPPAGFTESLDSGYATPNIGIETAYHLTPAAATTFTSTGGSYPWGIAVEIKLAVTTQNVTPAIIDRTAVITAPQINLNVTPAVIARTGVVTAPTVTPGPVNVTPAVIDQTAVVSAPQVNLNVALGLIDRTAVLAAPQINLSLAPALIDQTAVVTAPVVVTTQLVNPAIIDQAGVVTAPTVTPGPVNVTPDLIDQAGTPHAFSLSFITKMWRYSHQRPTVLPARGNTVGRR